MSLRVEPNAGPPVDLAAAMLECILNSRGAQQDNARTNAERAHELLERARQAMQEAMDRAGQADDDGDFWGDVSQVLGSDGASIAGVVAAVALAVATGGAGTAAVLAVAAALCTAGAKVGQELGLDPRVSAVMGTAGGALGLFAGDLSGAGNAATTVAQVAGGVQGAASGAGGGATMVEGHYRGEALDERATATAAQHRQNDAWLRFDLAIDALDRASRDVAHAQEGASSVESTENAGAESIINRIGAA